MNERIEELAEQAGNHYRTTTPGADTFTNPVYGVIPEKFLDKFAELIIRECVNIVSDGPKGAHPWHYGMMIEQHFGVEQ